MKRLCINAARVGALAGLAVASLAVAPAANAAVVNGNLPGGTSISVGITSPADGALIGSPPGDVAVSGTASVGEGVPVANTTLVYVVDRSGSTQQSAGGCTGNQNGDPLSDTVLDCEIAAGRALNQQAIAAGTVDETGVVFFDTNAVIRDVNPTASGTQGLTHPAADNNGSGIPDVEDVLRSATIGGSTNFEDAVRKACSLVQSSTNPNNVVVFLSDGRAETGGNALDDLPCAPKTAVFQTFAVGDSSSCTNTGNGRGSLAQIAQATGGSCTHVTDVATLPAVVPGVIGSRLTQLLLSVDGGAPVDISSSATPNLPVNGPASVSFSTTVPGLTPGTHSICVTAVGSDGGGTGQVTDCHNVVVADITLAPPTATNELGTPGQTHTVTATVAAGPSGGVAGVPVSFSIVSGPNTGQSGNGTTDGAGQAAFTYPAAQGPAGLGTDSLQACFTDSQGVTNCASATKQWVDTTPPVVQCAATTNPSGNNVPKAGDNPKSGQNPDGFYVLTATDAVDPNPTVTVRDSESGATFGPFPSGTKIKLTQAPGAPPAQKPGAGDVDHHITINGDALLLGTDASGNTSSAVSCLVPPPPK